MLQLVHDDTAEIFERINQQAYFSNKDDTCYSFKRGAAQPCPNNISGTFSKHIHVFDYKPTTGKNGDEVAPCCRELEAG